MNTDCKLPSGATTAAPWENSLGMRFVPAPGTEVLFSIWDTRVQDYEVFVRAKGLKWEKPSFAQGPTHPAVNVSWNYAKAFCVWLTESERRAGLLTAGESYRLPMDWEWSVAVGLDEPREGTPAEKSCEIKGVYPWGTQWPPPRGAGNYSSWLGVDDFGFTSPVGTFAANRYGLFDMGGNVRQWCEDLWESGSGGRVLRGASWGNIGPDDLLSSYRDSSVGPDRSCSSDGFRCVLMGVSSR
jgi:formylglycine-generating enzyme required for sulfatase activity